MDGKRREMQFVRSEKIEEMLDAGDTAGSFLRAFRDLTLDAPKPPPRPSCEHCGAYMAWGADEKPECPFCDGGVGD